MLTIKACQEMQIKSSASESVRLESTQTQGAVELCWQIFSSF